MSRIALATCEHHPGFIADDDAPLLRALSEREAEGVLARWDDPGVDWAGFDAVVLRTTWDYQTKLDAFLAWIERVSGETLLLNPAEVVRANIYKTYLETLERDGVPIVPTHWIKAAGEVSGDGRSLFELDCTSGADEIIVKPEVGAGASDLGRFAREQFDDAGAHVRSLLDVGPVMVQPFVPSILERGELSIVLIDGEYSHSVRKVVAPGEFRVQIEFGGRYAPVEPSEAELDVARRALASMQGMAQGAGAEPLAYARIDIVEPAPDAPAIIEIELIEPELFLPIVPECADRLAGSVLRRVEAAG